MSKSVITVKIAGPAGFGIKSGGQLLSKILIRHGFYVYDYNEYPSLVRGGHNTFQISFSSGAIHSPHFNVDYFFSVEKDHWQAHQDEFSKNTLVFSDQEFFGLTVPLKKLAAEAGNPLSINTVCLGIVAHLLGLNLDLCREIISLQFGASSESNLNAFNLGIDYSVTNFVQYKKSQKLPTKTVELSNNYNDGNEAFGWGLLKGGCSFYAAYPMTPSTGVLHFLAEKQKTHPIVVIHPEDEIAAANMVVGASFAGARAAVGTSGGGFALMNEAVSLCGVAEIGAVFYLVSRPGPATGMPTWTSQGDLLHAIFSGHGEFPKVVISPSSHQESFEFGTMALNLAAKLQTPVIVISDKFLAESSALTTDLSIESVKIDTGKKLEKTPADYQRYQFSSDGISPVTIPGVASGEFLANSYEHDQMGFSVEDAPSAKAMMDKRFRKNATALKLVPKAEFIGSSKSKRLIISWGSTRGPILEVLKEFGRDDFALLHLKTLWPIDPSLHHLIDPFKEVIVVENNQTSPLTTILKSQFDFHPTHHLLKYDGRPFFPQDLVKEFKKLL